MLMIKNIYLWKINTCINNYKMQFKKKMIKIITKLDEIFNDIPNMS